MKDRLLIVGANGNIGKHVSNFFSSKGFIVIEGSSRPRNNQIKIDYKSKVEAEIIPNIDFAILCGRVLFPYDQIEIENEIDFLLKLHQKGVSLFYIGSASSWLSKPNNYGKYKKVIEDKVLELEGSAITCGLIYSRNFNGQISRLRNFFLRIPINFLIKDTNSQFLTPLEAIFVTLENLIQFPQPRKRLFVAHKAPYPFDFILNSTRHNSKFSFKIRRRFVEASIKFLCDRNSYFNSDSLKGLFGTYETSLWKDAASLNFDLDEKFSSNFEDYFGAKLKIR